MKYYLLESSHWPNTLEFKSKIDLKEGQCFRITSHDGYRDYPTRFKVVEVSDTQKFSGTVVEIITIDSDVEAF
jgi:hypothetical protein